MDLCNCGIVKQRKVGTYVENGVEFCASCRKPTTVSPEAVAASTRRIVPPSHVTTLQALPGYRIIGVHGVVSMLSGASGFTAQLKGNEALGSAMSGLQRAAADMGANAIVGLTTSTFGAKGGITSAFGGDAVGVLLVGTAVTVASDPAP